MKIAISFNASSHTILFILLFITNVRTKQGQGGGKSFFIPKAWFYDLKSLLGEFHLRDAATHTTKKKLYEMGVFPTPYNKLKSLNKAIPFSFQFDNGCHFIRRHAAEIDDTFFL